MLTGVIILLLTVMVLAFLFIYKKEMIIKMFTLNASTSANEFNQQLELTADSIIRRLEAEAAQLELLLEEAEEKIGMLSQQVEHANKIIEQLTDLPKEKNKLEKSNSQDTNEIIEIDDAENPVSSLRMEVAAVNDEVADKFDEDDLVDREPNLEKHRLIIGMYDQGYSVTDIAKATGMGKGEVMLLLQLNKK
ncbi:hypothetical protein SRRS_23700 [Sporomusa rhizae]|uniref:DUF6115 domain-containing protein n=1 Tax=Sporomusa rhizae TaxID=357999 RepID=UPI00352A7E9F